MQGCEEKEERLMLLESWREFEDEFGSFANKERVQKLLPEKVKKRRKITAEDGVRVHAFLRPEIVGVFFLQWVMTVRVCMIGLFTCFNQLQIHQMHMDQSWNMDLWIVCFDQESI